MYLLWYVLLASVVRQVAGSYQRSTPTDYAWSICYDVLGCVNNTEHWYHPTLRPLKERPLERHIIKTTFLLFAKHRDPRRFHNVEPLDPIYGHIKATNFDGRRKLHLLVHDFTGNGVTGWIERAVTSILTADLGIVVSVDWSGGAEPPYSVAVQNARVVALEIAHLLKILIDDFGTNPEQIHLVGQGVGAHIAGYVGQQISRIGRITGLDPNGLYFTGMPCITRLDPDDAKFVDVINTDIDTNRGQGSGEPYGHLNFYPNGGLTQPGCNATSLYPTLDSITRDAQRQGEIAPGGCSHGRAAEYFVASIDERKDCSMMGYLCVDYATFERGDCLECKLGYTCAPIGYAAAEVSGNCSVPPGNRMFLDTNDERPYCMFAYKVIVTLTPEKQLATSNGASTTGEEALTVSGIFCATVYSDAEGIVFRTNLNVGVSQKPIYTIGDNVFVTFQKGPRLTRIDRVVLRFDSEVNGTVIYVTRVRVVPVSNQSSNNSTIPLCGRHEVTKFLPHTQAEFTPCGNSSCRAAKREDSSRPRRNPDVVPLEGSSLDEYDYYVEQPPPEEEDDDDEYYDNRRR